MGLLSMIAELGININPFTTGLAQAKQEAESFAGTVSKNISGGIAGAAKGLSGALAGMISVEALKRATDYGVEVRALGRELNTTLQNAQAYKYAAGDSVDALAVAFRKISVAIAKADTKEMSEHWKMLGFDLDELAGKRPEQIFERIAAAVKAGELSNREYAAVLAIMGKGAGELLPKLSAIVAKTQEFKKSGFSLSDSAVNTLADAGKGTKLTGSFLKYLGLNIASGAIGGVEGLAQLGIGTAGSLLSMLTGFTDLGQRGIGSYNDIALRGINKLQPFHHFDTTADQEAETERLNKLKEQADANRKDIKAREANIKEAREAEALKKETEELEKKHQLEERIKSVRFAMMTNDEKRAELQKRLTADTFEMYQAETGSLEEKEAQLKVAEDQEGLQRLDSKKDKVKSSLSGISADHLASVGTYIGGGSATSNPLVDLGQRQLAIQQEIAANTAQGNRSSFDSGN